jgi:DNA-binding transcriptional LysR family regulator
MSEFNPPPLFDWTLMRSFIAVIDEGSLQAAARRLHSSQPTVGRHITLLEQQLETRLFDRRARQLLPTPLALDIARHARNMEACAQAIGLTLRAQDQNHMSEVRISASQCTACFLLPPILQALRVQELAMAVELVSSNQVANLQKREADIAVRMQRPSEECLVARRLGQVNLGVYAHRNYLEGRTLPRKPEDLLAHDLLGYDQQLAILQGFERWGMPVGREAFAYRTDDHMMVWQAIEQGLGIGFTAHYIARKNPDLVRLLADFPIEPLEVWLTLHEDLRASPGIRRVFDFLATHLSQRLAEADNQEFAQPEAPIRKGPSVQHLAEAL